MKLIINMRRRNLHYRAIPSSSQAGNYGRQASQPQICTQTLWTDALPGGTYSDRCEICPLRMSGQWSKRTDNGTEFTKRFTSASENNLTLFQHRLAEHGIRHQLIRPFTPRHNGKVERSYRKYMNFPVNGILSAAIYCFTKEPHKSDNYFTFSLSLLYRVEISDFQPLNVQKQATSNQSWESPVLWAYPVW